MLHRPIESAVIYGNYGEMIQNQIEAVVRPAMEFANTVDGEHANLSLPAHTNKIVDPTRNPNAPIRLKPL
jgi:hypothetical protein